MSIKLSTRGIKRLEMTMRDVLDGLEDAAIYTTTVQAPILLRFSQLSLLAVQL